MTKEARMCVESCREWYQAFSNFGKGEERSVKELLAVADLIESLSAQLDQVTRERDAAESNKFQYETGFIKGFEAAYPKWISVKERLPEDGQIVLAYAAGCCDLLQWSAVEETWLSDIGWSKKGDVTHWIPLPSPPKEDE